MRTLFKELIVNAGDIKAGQKNVPVEWFFQDITADEIVTYKDKNGNEKIGVTFGCQCTGTPELLPDRLRVNYNDGGNNKGTVKKGVVVYHRPGDDIPVRVRNEKGVEVFNPALGKTVLEFYVNIKD